MSTHGKGSCAGECLSKPVDILQPSYADRKQFQVIKSKKIASSLEQSVLGLQGDLFAEMMRDKVMRRIG
jgi:hypothetical protein